MGIVGVFHHNRGPEAGGFHAGQMVFGIVEVEYIFLSDLLFCQVTCIYCDTVVFLLTWLLKGRRMFLDTHENLISIVTIFCKGMRSLWPY